MKEQERFEKFTEELSELSLKYDIVIQSIGGIKIFYKNSLKVVSYDNDSTSSDLIPYYQCK